MTDQPIPDLPEMDPPPPPPGWTVEPLHKRGRPPGLHDALSALQGELPKIHKDNPVDTGTYSYSYADLTAVSEAVMPLLSKHGLAFTAWPTRNAEGIFVLRYELLHISGEAKTGEYPLSGGNAQAIGSAITYARRYCLCAVTGVSPDDDDDAAATHATPAGRSGMVDPELQSARDSFYGSWELHYGGWDQHDAEQWFRSNSKAGTKLWDASPRELRGAAAYLANLPTNTAGSDPATQTDGGATPTRPGDSATPSAAAGAPPSDPPETETSERMMTAPQRARIFAELTKLGIRDAAEQRTALGEIIGRPLKSRRDLTLSEAKQIIDTFETGVSPVDPAPQEEL